MQYAIKWQLYAIMDGPNFRIASVFAKLKAGIFNLELHFIKVKSRTNAY